MRVSTEAWKQATINLKARRKAWSSNDDNQIVENPIRNYRSHLNKCGYGATVLDVGCGAQYLKTCLRPGTYYEGIDAFPAEGFEHCTTELNIENSLARTFTFDTVCAFAVLDNCLDLDKAIENMKLIAQKNIIILTGIGIEVDKFHTMKIELIDIDSRMEGFTNTHREELAPKVWLLNYEK